MQHKGHLFLVIPLLIFMLSSIICGTLFYLQTNIAEQNFLAQANAQLDSMENQMLKYIEPGTIVLRSLSKKDIIINSQGQLSSYKESTETTPLLYANFSEYEKILYSELVKAQLSHNSFRTVFLANTEGQYSQAPGASKKPAGYDPRQRPWYKEIMASDEETLLSTPYETSAGGVVTSLLTKLYTPQNQLFGTIGVDFLLYDLIRPIRVATKILPSQYIVAIDVAGQVIADKKHPENVYKNIKDLPPEWTTIFKNSHPHVITVHNDKKFIAPRESKELNWKIYIIIDHDELSEDATTFYYLSLLFGLFSIFFLLALLANIVNKNKLA